METAAVKLAERILSKTIKPKVASKLSHLGELFDFEVNLKDKQVAFVIHLKGEVEPLEGSLRIIDFNFTEKEGKLLLVVRKVSLVAREWMAAALEQYWPGEVKFEISDNEYILKALKAAGMLI
jgi:hypothetical protein